MKRGRSNCRRIWNVDAAYLRNAIREYRAKAGVTAVQICKVLDMNSSVLSAGKIKEKGMNASVLFKVCAIVGLDPYDEKLFIGGKPDYKKPVVQEEEQTVIEVVQDPKPAAEQKEIDALKLAIERLEAELNGIREVLI